MLALPGRVQGFRPHRPGDSGVPGACAGRWEPSSLEQGQAPTGTSGPPGMRLVSLVRWIERCRGCRDCHTRHDIRTGHRLSATTDQPRCAAVLLGDRSHSPSLHWAGVGCCASSKAMMSAVWLQPGPSCHLWAECQGHGAQGLASRGLAPPWHCDTSGAGTKELHGKFCPPVRVCILNMWKNSYSQVWRVILHMYGCYPKTEFTSWWVWRQCTFAWGWIYTSILDTIWG